jgi:hypothetical protein
VLITSGFNIENMHLTDTEWLEKWLTLVTIAFLGYTGSENGSIRPSLPPSRLAQSIFRYDLDF